MVAPSPELVGGQSVQAARLLEALEGEPTVRASFLRTDTALRGPLSPLRSVRCVRTLVRLPLHVLSLLVRVPRCDVVHAFAASYWSFVLSPTPAVLLAKLLGRKVVVDYHSGEAADHLARWPTAVRTLRLADAIVVQSAYLEDIFARFDLPTTVIPNHLPADALPFRLRRPLRPSFLSTRALEPVYGVETTLRAIAIIQHHVPDATLRIVGEGSCRGRLEALVQELGLRSVTFSGAVEAARMPEVYGSADVLLNASTVDNMPLSLLEAFSSGLPVVSTAAGGIPCLVRDGETGLLVDADDAVGLAEAAVRLLRDDDLATRLATAARGQVAKYAWSATGPQWLRIYEQLAGARSTSTGKLRGRSVDELRVRGMQALYAMAERARVAGSVGPATAELVAGAGSSAELLERFRSRESPRLSPAFAERDRTAAELRRRFGGTTGPALVARAERIVEGRFEILGYGDLSFGSPIDWHLDPVAGERVPLVHWSRLTRLDPRAAVDRKIVWELNRHQAFVVLGRAYWLTGDERYAETFAGLLDDWIEANPPGLGVNWTSSLEIALRIIAWTWALTLFRDSSRLAPELFGRALHSLSLQARHVARYPSTYSSPNTHVTGEALGLFYAGTLWPELGGAAAWRKAGLDTLLSSIPRHVTADGVYFERSSTYHLYTIDFYAHLLVVARANGIQVAPSVPDRLDALLDCLLHTTRPDGTVALVGDDDGGRLLPLDERAYGDARPTLALGAALMGRADHKTVGGDASEELLWLRGADGIAEYDQLEPQPPATTSRAFRQGGVYVLRDGWTESANVLVLDCGEHGGGHDHAGALGFHLSVGGRPVLVDPGTWSYRRGCGRGDWFRSTAAHNTVVVDNESSSVPDGPFRWAHRARAELVEWQTDPHHDYFEGSHDGYHRLADPVTHVRSVVFVRGSYWVIQDRLEAVGAHRYEIRFHFTAGARVTLENRHGSSLVVERSLQIATFGPGAWRLSSGDVSPRYGARELAPVAGFVAQSEGPQRFVSFLLPGRAATVREVHATGGRAFEIRAGATHELFVLGDRGAVETAEVAVPTTPNGWGRRACAG